MRVCLRFAAVGGPGRETRALLYGRAKGVIYSRLCAIWHKSYPMDIDKMPKGG
jgi:hypothetical protein